MDVDKIMGPQKEKNCGAIENLPEEMFQLLLSYLPFEEIDKLRSVNRKFNASCSNLLKRAYYHVKREVALCCERARLRLTHYDEDLKCLSFRRCEYLNRIFWFTVSEMLSNSFCLFNYLTGYLDEKYSVNGKTIDIVKLILRFKDMEDPYLYLIEAAIGRGGDNSNMKYFNDFAFAHNYWFYVKKYNVQNVTTVFRPVLVQYQPDLNLPKYHATQKTWMYAHILDILSTLWIEKERMGKRHLVLPEDSFFTFDFSATKAIYVSKPGQEEPYVDTDPERYEMAYRFKEYEPLFCLDTLTDESPSDDNFFDEGGLD